MALEFGLPYAAEGMKTVVFRWRLASKGERNLRLRLAAKAFPCRRCSPASPANGLPPGVQADDARVRTPNRPPLAARAPSRQPTVRLFPDLERFRFSELQKKSLTNHSTSVRMPEFYLA